MSIDQLNTHIAFRSLVTNFISQDAFLHENDDWNVVKTLVESEGFRFLSQHINGFIAIFNYKTGVYEYLSESLTTNLGHKREDLLGETGVQYVLYSVMDRSHANYFVDVILNKVLSYLSAHATLQSGRDYRFNCTLKLRNVYNTYKWYILDTVIIQTDQKGFPFRTMITCTNIDSFKKDENVYYNVIKKDAAGVYEVVLEGYANKEENEIKKLTPREIEVLALIAQGFSNKQISAKLNLKDATTKTHRKNILAKTGCKGSVDLANFAFARGLR